MAKKIITALMIAALICFMIVPANAAETKLPIEVLELHYLYWNESLTSSTQQFNWNSTTNNSFNFNGKTLSEPQQFFLGVTLDSIMRANQIIVWSFTITNTEKADLDSKIKYFTSSGFESKVSYNTLEAYTYDFTILTETRQIIDETNNTVRFTVTAKTSSGAEGKNGLIWWMRDLTLADTAQYNRVISEVNVYESIQAAASSGTTPEEMRSVLQEWGEEDLLPGIQDSVQAGVTSGMEEALQNEKQEASSGAQGGLDELAGALSGVTDDIEKVQSSFQSLGAALSYSGQTAVLSVPAIVVPGMGQISDARTFNLTQEIDNIVPSALLTAIRSVLSLSLISYPIIELIKQLRKLLSN